MKKRITKILGVVLSLALLSSLAMVAAPVAAAPGENDWGKITLPGVTDDTDVELLAVAADGTIFASVNDDGDRTVWSSADGGWTWKKTMMATEGVEIMAIVCAPNWDTNDTFYAATADGEVFRCVDAGLAEPVLLRAIVGSDPFGSDELVTASIVYDMDLWTDGDNIWILVATDIDVLVMEDALFASWVDMDLTISFDGAHASHDGTPHDVFDQAFVCRFAPDFNQTGLIWTILRDTGDDAWITATISPGQWGQVVNSVEVVSSDQLRDEVDLDFADYYSSTAAPILFAALNFRFGTDGDDVYLIEGGFTIDNTIATPLDFSGDAEIDPTSIEVSGQVIMVGARWDADVWISRNGGDSFAPASKPPTGEWKTQVLMAPGPFDADTGVAYAATRGDESAFSYTTDGGETWNQTAFINTDIDDILDLAFGSPTILLTDDWGGPESIWRCDDATAKTPNWERVYNDYQSDMWGFFLVEYSMSDDTLMLFGRDGGDGKFEKSVDYGQTWTYWRTLPSALGNEVNDFVVYNSATVYAACEGGFFGTSLFGPPKQRLIGTPYCSIALQNGFDPNDPDNSTILIGGCGGGADDGDARASADGGNTWSAAVSVGSGDVFVAFDSSNNGYFATSGSTVSKGTVSGGKITKVATLKDAAGAYVDADIISGLHIAPDDALYVMGADLETGASTYTFDADGTVDLVAANPTVSGTIAVECALGLWASDLELVDKEVTRISGSFADGELVSVVEFNVVCAFDHWELLSEDGDTATYVGVGYIDGEIGVQGVDSGATGFMVIDAADMEYECACWVVEVPVLEKGSFETGDLSGWTVGGLGASVEALQSTNITPAIVVPDGSYFAMLSTGPGEVNPASDVDIDGSTYLNSDTATLSQTFTIDAPATLSFDWAWMTDEEDQAAQFDDIFHVTLNGIIIASGSVDAVAGDTSPYPNVVTDDVSYSVNSLGPTNGSIFADGGSAAGWATVNYAIPAAGTYTLEFLAADNANHTVDSALLVDNVRLDDVLLRHAVEPATPDDMPVVVISSFLLADLDDPVTIAIAESLAGTAWDIGGEDLIIVDCDLAGNATGGVTGTIVVEGATSGEQDEIAIDIATDLGFEDGELVSCIDSSLDVIPDETAGTTTSNEAMMRLLLDEPYNVWEIKPKAGACGLWGSNSFNTLWTVVDNDELWACMDTLSGPVQNVSVAGITETGATVSWDAMPGDDLTTDTDLVYEVMYDSATVETGKTSAKLSGLSDDTEYEVVVRVHPQPLSPWSSRWSSAVTFVTAEEVAKPCSLGDMVPENGMQNAPIQPSFVWPAVPNAEEYDFQLSTETDFSVLIVDVTIDAPVTAYTCEEVLAYDTNHYWRVRAVSTDSKDGGDTVSLWCTLNFHTRTEELPPPDVDITLPPPEVDVTVVPPDVTVIPPDVNVTLPPPVVTVVPPDITVDVPQVVTVTQQPQPTIILPEEEEPGTPVYIWVIVAIGAILTIAVIVLIIRTRRVV